MKGTETREECIIRLHQQGHSANSIHELTNIRTPRIKYTILYFQRTGKIPPPAKAGRPSTTKDNNTLSVISALTLMNRFTPCYQISQELLNQNIHCSTSSVWRRKKELGFDYRPPKIRQSLTEDHKKDRVKFAHSIFQNNIDFDLLVFSDESRFCLGPDNRCRWMRKNDRTNDCFSDHDKFSKSIMVYGAIGKNYKSELVFCDSNVDSQSYKQNIIKSGMIQVLDLKYGSGNYIFMQDGAPAHKSSETSLFLKKRLTYLKKWPANSPDLNPIEHVWGAMKRILKNKQFRDLASMKIAVQEIWNTFPIDSINKLVESFQGRLMTVIQYNGESISDILRSGITHFPQFPLQQIDDIYSYFELISRYDPSIDEENIEVQPSKDWSEKEIIFLFKKVEEFGHQWSKIVNFFPGRTASSLQRMFNKCIRIKNI